MAGILWLLLAASIVGVNQADEDTWLVLRWIRAAQSHHPGTIDEPLVETACESPRDFAVVARKLRTVLAAEFVKVEDRNNVLRRGAILHTDVAVLLPETAATFIRSPQYGFDVRTPVPDALVYSLDGEFLASAVDTGHWWMARMLAALVAPDPSKDPFVRDWYRAVTAHLLGSYRLGSAGYHLSAALKLLPHDPVLLFYAGAMSEAYTSARVQSVLTTRPVAARDFNFPSPETACRESERRLREAIDENGPVEARVRLGHVLGRLGRHREAASLLRAVASQLDEPRLQYLCALFLGSEEGALGNRDRARESFERAAALFPTAQSPLIALADLAWRTSNRAAALDALRRLQRLPDSPAEREDPWRDYHRSFALDADAQLSSVRGWVERKEEP